MMEELLGNQALKAVRDFTSAEIAAETDRATGAENDVKTDALTNMEIENLINQALAAI